MTAHVQPPPTVEHPYAAVLVIDPAAVAPCGIACRLTAGLSRDTQRGRLRVPEFTYEGSVWSTQMHDDLGEFLYRGVERGAKVLVVAENSAFNGTARHLGRAIGCIEGLLHDLNLADPSETKYVAPAHWRKTELPLVKNPGRDGWKQASIDAVASLYGLDCGDNMAEAILMCDHVTLAKSFWWTGKPKRRRRSKK